MRRWPLLGALLVPAWLVASCQSPTQVEVIVSTDPGDVRGCDAVRSRGVELHTGPSTTAAERPGGAPPPTENRCAADGRVGNIFLLPADRRDAAFALRVVLGVTRPTSECAAPRYEGCIVARRQLRYRPHGSLRLPVKLSLACLDVPCDEVSTCDPIRVACVSSVALANDDGTTEIPGDAALVDVPASFDAPVSLDAPFDALVDDVVVLDGPAPLDAPADGIVGMDAPMDTGADAPFDAGADAPIDAGSDASDGSVFDGVAAESGM